MNKRLNLVYEWIGPRGPLTNNRLPTLADFVSGIMEPTSSYIDHCHYQCPHFYGRFFDVNLCSSSMLPDSPFIYEFNFSIKHYSDVPGIFSDSHGFLSHAQMDKEVKQRIKSNTAYIMITILYESYFSDNFLMAMTNYFKRNGFPLTQIIYVSNCANGKEIYENFCKRNNLQPEINVEYFPIFRIDKTDLTPAIKKYKTIPYKTGPRKKTFLNFNRRYSDHRLVFYTAISKKKLLDKFYISMSAIQPERSTSFIDNMKYTTTKYPSFEFIENDVIEASSHLPLILDNTNFNNYPMENTVDAVDFYYENSLINIISETFFFDKPIHITEKTFKPIAFKQPFIMIGSYGSLRHVKDLGFKTFSEFWNEDYDLIQDNENRMLTVLKIIDEIANWSEEQKISFTNKVKDIIEYNFNHLCTMKDFEMEQFIEKYGE